MAYYFLMNQEFFPDWIQWSLAIIILAILIILLINIVLVIQIRVKTGSLSAISLSLKEAERELRLLSSSVEQSREGIAVIDLQGNFLFVNSAFASLHTRKPEEMKQKHYSMIYQEEHLPLIKKAHEQVKKEGFFDGEMWHKRSDGSLFLGSIRNSFLKDENKKIVGTIYTLRDITKWKETENTLLENEQFLQNVFNAILDGISVLDRDLNIIRANAHMSKMYGDGFSITGRKCHEIFQGKDAQCMFCPSQKTLKTGKAHSEVVPFQINNITKGWLELSSFPFKNAKGEIVGVIEHVRNITHRKKTEKKLRQAQDFSKILLQASPAFYFSVDHSGKIIMINEAMASALGYTKDQVIGKKFLDVLIPKSEQTKMRNMFEKLSSSKSALSISCRILTNRGKHLYIDWKTKAIFKQNISNEVDFFFGIGLDITERKQLQNQLIQSKKMEALGRLAGGVAHDFNNLLTVISGSSQLLLEELSETSEQREEAQEIWNMSKRAEGLTKQLLVFSRREVIKRQVVDINHTVVEMKKMLRRLISEDIDLITNLTPNLVKVKADKTHIEQVILNLVVNAREALPTGGYITIETSNIYIKDQKKQLASPDSAGFARLSVIDSGPGIDSEIVNQIFDPFFTTKNNKGTGLGLSVVYGIVDQHEGWLDVNTEQSQGTRFDVFLPGYFVSLEKTQKLEIDVETKPQKGHGERVLLVEDEDNVRLLIKRWLTRNNYIVFEAICAREAKEIFNKEQGNFHLLFSDIILPGENGVQLAEDLQKQAPQLKIILASGYAGEKLEINTIKEKGFYFLQKPYSPYELLKAMESCLGH